MTTVPDAIQPSDYSLRIRSPAVEEIPQDLVIPAIPRSNTVGELKGIISGLVTSHPNSRRQRLIYRGRLLDDDQATLASVLGDLSQTSEPVIIHLVLHPVAEEPHQRLRNGQPHGQPSNSGMDSPPSQPNLSAPTSGPVLPNNVPQATFTFSSINRGPPVAAHQAMMLHQQAMQHQFAMLAQNQAAVQNQSMASSQQPDANQTQQINQPHVTSMPAQSAPIHDPRQPIPLRQFQQAWHQQRQGSRDPQQRSESPLLSNADTTGAQPTAAQPETRGAERSYQPPHPRNHTVSVRNMRFHGMPMHGLPAPPMVNFMPPPFVHAPHFTAPTQTPFSAGLPLADGELYLVSSPQGPEALLWKAGGLYRGSQTYIENLTTSSNLDATTVTPAPPPMNILGNTIIPTNPQEAQQLGMDVEEVDILQLIGRAFVPLAGHLWLILRLAGFMYLFMGGATWQRIITLSIGGLILVAAQAGMLRPMTDAIWGALRHHHNRVAGHGDPRGPERPIAEDNNELDPQALAQRLLAQQQQRAQNAGILSPILSAAAQIERSLTIFIASLVPGLGDHRPPAPPPAQAAQQEVPNLEDDGEQPTVIPAEPDATAVDEAPQTSGYEDGKDPTVGENDGLSQIQDQHVSTSANQQGISKGSSSS